MQTLDIQSDPPDAALIHHWRKSRSRCDSLKKLGSLSGYLSVLVYVVGLVCSALPPHVSQFAMWVFFLGALPLGLLWFWTRLQWLDCAAETPKTDDLDPASLNDLAGLSAALKSHEVKIYLQKVTQLKRPLMHMECRMLMTASDELPRDAQRQAQRARVERETILRASL